MSDFVYNVGLGRVVEYAARVEANDPTNSALVAVVIDAGGASDASLKDVDTLAAVIATAADEVTNTNYSRTTYANGTLTITVDDTNDRAEVDLADLSWSSVGAGDSWTDVVFCYDSDTTGGDDTNVIPLTQHDAELTPDGSSITLTVNAAGFFRAS